MQEVRKSKSDLLLGSLAEQQIAVFFASNGATVIDPDGSLPIFERPIVLPLPEELNIIP